MYLLRMLAILLFITNAIAENLEFRANTIDEAVQILFAESSEEELKLLTSTPEEDLILYHHSYGNYIRNSFGLWSGNTALLISVCGEQCHPDDASMKIIETLWQMAREKL